LQLKESIVLQCKLGRRNTRLFCYVKGNKIGSILI
jgi:hypothetical protein